MVLLNIDALEHHHAAAQDSSMSLSILDCAPDTPSWLEVVKNALECLSLAVRSWISELKEARFATPEARVQAIKGFLTRTHVHEATDRLYR